ncbi:MAG: hypothetical protein JJU10_05380 [Idiomarina sp.]|nr:hypothetical protein [Idiomarina sp.]
MNIKLLTLAAVLFACVTVPKVYAQQGNPACAGNWFFTLSSHQAEFRQEEQLTMWIPGEVRLVGNLKECISFVTMRGNRGDYIEFDNGLYRLNAQPFDDNRNPLMRTPDGDGWILPLQANRERQRFWFRVPQAGFANPGTYVATIEALLNGDDVTNTIRESKNAQFEFTIASLVSLKVRAEGLSWMQGSNSHYRIDLGALHSGTTREFDLIVRSNADVRLSISSANQGMLRHNDRPEALIPYQVRLQNTLMSLSNLDGLDLSLSGPSQDWRVPMRITIPDVGLAWAGQYGDIITVTAETRD